MIVKLMFSSIQRVLEAGLCVFLPKTFESFWFLPDEAEDEDDPEYNFLDEPDEPDLEDYRTDRAVQITSGCWRPEHLL